jgi:hypothetical protein
LLGNKCRNFATGLPSARKGIISENKWILMQCEKIIRINCSNIYGAMERFLGSRHKSSSCSWNRANINIRRPLTHWQLPLWEEQRRQF